jgi:phage tail protein X
MAGTYTTVQGDMWDSIAYAQLGDTAYTNQLIAANLRYREYYTFPAGIVLVLPEIVRQAGADTLPPWKKVGI